MSWKIAPELRARGYRDATSAFEWGIAGRGVKDPLWLYIIERSGVPSVLVSFDNKMPSVHRASIVKQNSTLAIIDSKANRQGRSREEYTREVGPPLGAPHGLTATRQPLQIQPLREAEAQYLAPCRFANLS
jgi:hypothetical protein